MKILMVCLGNICRSPLAEGILKDMAAKKGLRWTVDSAGTASYHTGSAPDKRSIQEARNHSIDISDQKCRQIRDIDFYTYDLILAMDSENYTNIVNIMPANSKSRVELIMNYSNPKQNQQVPDPYYEGGFDEVYEMLEKACTALIDAHELG